MWRLPRLVEFDNYGTFQLHSRMLFLSWYHYLNLIFSQVWIQNCKVGFDSNNSCPSRVEHLEKICWIWAWLHIIWIEDDEGITLLRFSWQSDVWLRILYNLLFGCGWVVFEPLRSFTVFWCVCNWFWWRGWLQPLLCICQLLDLSFISVAFESAWMLLTYDWFS